MSNLFELADGNMSANSQPYQPLADRMRPKSLENIFGQNHILGDKKPLRLLIEAGMSGSVIFWGPPGCGKTTLAKILATKVDAEFIQLSAVTSGVKDLKKAFAEASIRKQQYHQKTLLFIDEIHRFNKGQQDALLPHVEAGTVIFIGATTENPSFEVISALLSRCQVMVLKPVNTEALEMILLRAISTDEQLNREPLILVEDDAISAIASMASGDARVALNTLETCCEVARQTNPYKPILTKFLVAETFQNKALRYDKGGDEHYNLISALHKSMRGSDPDASLYWLYRMIESGEKCRIILRRMIRFASEDIGMADPFALTLAMSTAQAFEYVGPPEGYLHIAQLAIYLATAPKSNAVYLAEKRVKKIIQENNNELGVPVHLRNAPSSLMKELGYGKEYKYPHNFQGGFVIENYFPEIIKDKSYYKPTNRGKEKSVSELLNKLWPQRRNKKGMK